VRKSDSRVTESLRLLCHFRLVCVRKKRRLRLFVHATTRELLSGYSRNLHFGIIRITVEPLDLLFLSIGINDHFIGRRTSVVTFILRTMKIHFVPSDNFFRSSSFRGN